MKYDFYITGTIGEVFDWWTGQRGTTAAMVKEFLDKNKDKELNIAVSSPGGYLDEGIAIAELIHEHGHCNMVIVGMTASSATVLCMKAASVKIARGSLMLIHNSSQFILGKGMSNKNQLDTFINELKKTRENLDTIDKAIADIYSCRNAKSIDENLALMDKEKWMTAQEAVDFGIVDGILEDEDIVGQAKAIQNVYASYDGIEEHYCLPAFPKFDKADVKVPKGIIARLRSIFNDFRGVIENEHTDNNHNPINAMKKIVLNLVCAVLAVQDLAIGENGEATLTETQLNTLENSMKEKNDRISALEEEVKKAVQEKQNAETDKAKSEQLFAQLKKEFDEFKEQAGDDTMHKPAPSGVVNRHSSADMYNDIKQLL